MNKAITMALKLLAITGVAALVLAFTNSATAPIIAERKAAQLAESLIVAYPDAESFESMEGAELTKALGSSENVTGVAKAIKGGETIGYVFSTSGSGYGGKVQFILGISNDHVIQGYHVMSHSETPGIGTKIFEDPFKASVPGTHTNAQVTAAADPSGDNDIYMISGSTYSTNAIVDGINNASAVMNAMGQ